MMPLRMLARVLGRPAAGAGGPSSFESYRSFLPGLLALRPPRRVLEFGPGASTRLLLAHSQAEIVSIETSKRWHRRYRAEFAGEPRLDLRLRARDWDMSELEAEVGSGFDLVFVDGGARQEALVQSRPLLAPGGIAVLHDAHRDDYYWALLRYRFLFPPERHSVVLSDDAEAFRAVVSGLETDHDTLCRYCSRPYRRCYFEDLLARSRRDCSELGIAVTHGESSRASLG